MKIAIASDLHLEFGNSNIIETFSREPADVLVLAGDVFVGEHWRGDKMFGYGKEALDFFKHVCDFYPHVVYITGNHEFYHGDIDKTKILLSETFERMSLDNFHFLNDKTVTIDGQQFFGGTLWSGLTGVDTEDWFIKQRLKDSINDFKLIGIEGRKLRIDDMQTMFTLCVERMKRYVKENCVIVTHNAPSFKCVHNKYAGSVLNWMFANECDKLIHELQPKLWIHGHMHDPVDLVIDNTRVVCNPRGYQRLETRPAYFEVKVVDV